MIAYHCSLLQALKRNAHKFRQPSLSEETLSRPEIVIQRSFSTRALGYQQRFESQLLILLTKELTPESFKSFPLKDARTLENGLDALFSHLNDVSNITLQTGHVQRGSGPKPCKSQLEYPRLDYVVALLDNSRVSIEISGNTRSSMFKFTTLEHAKNAHTFVTEVNRILQETQLTALASSSSLAANKSSRTHEAFERWIQPLVHTPNERLGKLLDAIEKDFNACSYSESLGCNQTHKVRVELADYKTETLDGQKSLDTCLYCPEMNQWRVARCEIKSELCTSSFEQPPLCHYIKDSQDRNESLSLLFHENSSFFSHHPDVFELKHGPLSFSLKELIEEHDLFAIPVIGERFKLQERRALAAKLALHLLIFCPWRHTTVPWDSNSVHFLRSSVQLIDKDSPFIAWEVGLDSSSALGLNQCIGSETDELGLHQTTGKHRAVQDASLKSLEKLFTSFAKLLLEIEYGKMSNTGYPLDEGNLAKSLRKYHDELRKTADPITHGGYLQAVEYCLRFHRAYENARLYQILTRRTEDSEDPKDTYQRLVRTNIASNVLIDLLDLDALPTRKVENDLFETELRDSSFESDFEFIDDDDVPCYHDDLICPTVPEAGTYLKKYARSIMPRHWNWNAAWSASPQRDPKVAQTVSVIYPEQTSSTPPADRMQRIGSSPHMKRHDGLINSAHTQEAEMIPRDVLDARIEEIIQNLPSDSDIGYLHDDNIDPSSLIAQQRRTDKWFENFLLLFEAFDFRGASGRPLRIAILDSGIDFDNKEFNNEERDRMKKFKSFVDDKPKIDTISHGTYVAAIILRLTVNVDLYIAKVTKTDKPTKETAVKAINYARTVWKVDMISLSFGFETSKPSDGLQAEIEECRHCSIQVFASASNDGAEGKRTYPAKFPGVICVHSSNERGASSGFNPLPENKSDLSFVGEQIRPVWGRSDLSRSTSMVYRNGTSYATPVAVSIAAFMVGWIELRGWAEWQWMYPPQTTGMEHTLRMMSVPTEVYRWVSPTRYFKNNGMKLIEAMLDNRLVRGNVETMK